MQDPLMVCQERRQEAYCLTAQHTGDIQSHPEDCDEDRDKQTACLHGVKPQGLGLPT